VRIIMIVRTDRTRQRFAGAQEVRVVDPFALRLVVVVLWITEDEPFQSGRTADIVDPAGDAAPGNGVAACVKFASVPRVEGRQIERSPEVIR